jgi:hypothetical protein
MLILVISVAKCLDRVFGLIEEVFENHKRLAIDHVEVKSTICWISNRSCDVIRAWHVYEFYIRGLIYSLFDLRCA